MVDSLALVGRRLQGRGPICPTWRCGLSEEVVEWVADATGGTIAATGRVPGGATRC